MRIFCRGYVDVETSLFNLIERTIDRIESGEYQRPEFEIHDLVQSSSSLIEAKIGCLAVFVESDETFCGWLVTKRGSGSGKEMMYCKRNSECVNRFEGLVCGCPYDLYESAVLNRHETIQLLRELSSQGVDERFELLSSLFAFGIE